MKISDEAVDLFTRGFNCSQSVFTPIASLNGIPNEDALKIASAFGGGMARLQETCGAVTGALMAIGLLQGHSDAEDKENKELAYAHSREFVARFKKKHGTTNCFELLGCSLLTDEGKARMAELNLAETVCKSCVKDAAEILEEMGLTQKP